MSDKPQGVKVEALKAHTYNGQSYEVGDVYDFYPSTDPGGISADAQLASLQSTGFATRVDRAKVAKDQAKAAEKAAEQPKSARKAKAPKASKKR